MSLSAKLDGLAARLKVMAMDGGAKPIMLRAVAALLDDHARDARALEAATLASAATAPRMGENVVVLRPVKLPIAPVIGGAA